MTEFNSGYMERFFSMPAPKEESDTGMREIELENLLAFHTGDGIRLMLRWIRICRS